MWLREIPDFHLLCSTVFLAKPSSRAACDPEQAELVVGPGHSAAYGVNVVGRHINNLRYADDTTLMAESEEELKNLLIPNAL